MKCENVSSKQLRETEENGFCFLIEKEAMWGEMLADVLRQEGVPFVIQKELGGGLADRVGSILERYYFYVPADQLEQAQQIAAGLFSAEEGE